ncbi:hypothetical protein [Chondromyces apiculatus]|uniref:Lipoprotein n=1 Tax=Chondromyces apiculatus DSM 436 TaxID=1192034 RepID=A0A017TC55_9BACT|nr:hypothetical protein [Chondromyces apiculatus]EYF06390.1 Hypothetical protein CAP_1920 [Chondromyces apiculatus DSM 436]
MPSRLPRLRRSLVLVVFVMLAALLTGCGPQWQVVRQAAPNPLANQRTFAVLPINFAGLTVGEMAEADYLARKDPEQRESFEADKRAVNEEFTTALVEGASDGGINVVLAKGPGSAPFEIRPMITFIEPGFYVGLVSKPSEVRMTLLITMPDGRIIDEILMVHGTDSARSGFSIGGISLNPSSGGRLRKDGEKLGEIVAEYLRERVGG